MDQKEIKLLSVLLINGGVFYIQRIKKRKKRRSQRSYLMKNGLSNVIHLVLITPFLESFI